MSWARRATAFVWDFVVGDDWRLAATAVIAIGGAAIWVEIGINAWWWLPVVLGAGLWAVVRR
jgi:hypothetical protein